MPPVFLGAGTSLLSSPQSCEDYERERRLAGPKWASRQRGDSNPTLLDSGLTLKPLHPTGCRHTASASIETKAGDSELQNPGRNSDGKHFWLSLYIQCYFWYTLLPNRAAEHLFPLP